ncbi:MULTISPECIES: zinc transporter ZntB [Sphingomonas]|jgi:zinc transporter|uniref:Zinc transporter ZntB n=1 Tax=Sphingomonas zeae TaxID=1646122 RepID=A0A7Y6B766_9SPHN|nr:MULTISPECIES: zinc transporter ZntB [Sphingomonas]MBB4046560.1 zinc transporter [Sphingomonas zeae]MDK8184338.1 zinc transporter ZntB [Sphingomonas zeae]MDK8214573.1 zinc transporter ZntB [Sphingomonas sp. UMB7805-LC452B]NUU48670.1 zinc transporter ZntB [Sphingomonas zeae]
MTGFAYRIDGGKAEAVPIRDAASAQGRLVWVHLETNDAVAQRWLRESAHVADYVVDALTATETRPRCEAVGEGAFLNLRGRSSEPLDGSDMLASVRIWAVKGRVYSVTRRPLLAVDTVRQCVERGEVKDPGDLITAFATAITNDLDPDVARLGDDLDDCEEQLDERRVFQLRRTVSRVRVAAIGYRRFLNPQRAALEKLAALPGDWLADDDRLHLSAAADRAARMAEELESIRERSALIHETLTDLRAEQIDNRALVISIVAMVFLPLTFITGLYGMNVKVLPYAEEPWAFDAILGVCALISAGIVVYFVQKHWFRR